MKALDTKQKQRCKNEGSKDTNWPTQNKRKQYYPRALRGRECCEEESCKTSGARGPTIQSSMASQSLQLRSAASISASRGACKGRKNGIVSRGDMS